MDPGRGPHRDMAEKFINYILDPKVGARLSNFNRFATPNAAVKAFITSAPGHVSPRAMVCRPARRGIPTGLPWSRCSAAQRGLDMPLRRGEGEAPRGPWDEGLGKGGLGK